ncbi:4Fe-4S binding protein [Halanaerocella petrolearia]
MKKIIPKLEEFMQPEEGIKHFVEDETSLVHASEKSKTGYCIPELVIKYGSGIPKFKLKTMLTMMSTIKNARKSYTDVNNNPITPKTKAPQEFIEELVEYANDIGALNVAFVKLDRKDIFKNSTVLYENAIVVTQEMDKSVIEKAPSKETGHEVHRTYRELGIIVNKIAEFLRENGYSAQAGPALGGDVNYTLLAEKAGLGAIGNHGLLISPKVGPRQRIAAVYTSIENSPIKEKNDHIWIKDFCKECKKCVKECPSQAIYDEPQEDIYDTEKHIDYKKCAESFSDMWGCSICIKECTFNKTDYEKIKKIFK